MTNITETATYTAAVYQIATTDAVLGGVGGIANSQAQALANRTAYLKAQTDSLTSGLTGYAGINSPAFTGTPSAPTPAPGDNSTKLATTAYVQNALNGVVTVNVAGGADVVLAQSQYGEGIIILAGLLTANINVIFPTLSGRWEVANSTSGPFSIICKTAAGTGQSVGQGLAQPMYGDGVNFYSALSDFGNVATSPANSLGYGLGVIA
jgi:hypothetical protein